MLNEKKISEASIEQLKLYGLSSQKSFYLKNLATLVIKNEINFDKIKLPSVVNRFLGKFVDSMKGANLNRMKRAAILYKVIDAAGMTPQQLMADIQKIKQAMKND